MSEEFSILNGMSFISSYKKKTFKKLFFNETTLSSPLEH